MKSPPNVVKRVGTALLAIPIAVGLTYLGGWYFGVGLMLVGLVAQSEIYDLFRMAGIRSYRWAGLAVGAYVMVMAFLPAEWPHAVVFMVLAACSMLMLPFVRPKQPLHTLAATAFGLVYPILPLASLGYVRKGVWASSNETHTLAITLLFLVLIWVADSAAYFSGSMLGKHPLHKVLSPKKTWEGYAGGAISALLMAILFKTVLPVEVPWPHWIGIALVCGAVSPLGDLAESALKRAVDAKDSGSIFPGHGGMLDRIDSVIVAGPLLYLILLLI